VRLLTVNTAKAGLAGFETSLEGPSIIVLVANLTQVRGGGRMDGVCRNVSRTWTVAFTVGV
jgi:hypothetical protein